MSKALSKGRFTCFLTKNIAFSRVFFRLTISVNISAHYANKPQSP